MPPVRSKTRTSDEAALVAGYRSGLEDKIAAQITGRGLDPAYETLKVPYLKPSRNAKYSPDFRLPNGIVVETKGRFITEDRQKHILVKAQFPDLDIRFVFSNSRAVIRKGSPTTYADWCRKNGLRFADKRIPDDWFSEPVNRASAAVIARLLGEKETRA
jgi:hypothetical protein